jgi:hypothetical protein
MKKIKYKEEYQQLRPNTFYYSQHINKKIPFYNSEEYVISIGGGKCVFVSPYLENAMIRSLVFYDDGKKNLYKTIIRFYPNLDMMERDEFVNNFMNSHKMYPMESYPEDIKVYAINGRYSFTDGYDEGVFTITDKQELELNSIIKEYGSDKCFKHVRRWFSQYHKDRCCPILPEVAEVYACQYLSSKGVLYQTGFTWNDANTWINCLPIFCKTIVFWFFVYVLYKCLTD